MKELIEQITAAVASDANAEARALGAEACRTLLTVLTAEHGQPLIAPPAQGPTGPAAAIAMAIRGMPAEQLLDLAIARVRAALPEGTEVAPVAGFRFIRAPMYKAGQ